MNRFKSIISIELIGIQVWLQDVPDDCKMGLKIPEVGSTTEVLKPLPLLSLPCLTGAPAAVSATFQNHWRPSCSSSAPGCPLLRYSSSTTLLLINCFGVHKNRHHCFYDWTFNVNIKRSQALLHSADFLSPLFCSWPSLKVLPSHRKKPKYKKLPWKSDELITAGSAMSGTLPLPLLPSTHERVKIGPEQLHTS